MNAARLDGVTVYTFHVQYSNHMHAYTYRCFFNYYNREFASVYATIICEKQLCCHVQDS